MDIRRTKILFGGIAGFCAVVIVQMLSLDKSVFNNYLVLSLYSFAIGLPFSILGMLISYFKENYKKTFEESNLFLNTLILFALIIPTIGLGFIFLHFSYGIGIAFFVSIIVTAFMFKYWDQKIKSLNNKKILLTDSKKDDSKKSKVNNKIVPQKKPRKK